MNLGSPEEMVLWKAQAAANIQKANDNWPAAQKRWAAQNQ